MSLDLSRVWYTRCQVPTASGIALDFGWLAERYAQDGARLGILQEAPLEISLSHYDHSLRNLIREGGNVPAIVTRAAGTPTRLIGLTFIDEGQAIVADPRREPTRERLAGARIAVPAFAKEKNASHARAMALGGFESALGSIGMTLADVTLIETPLQRTIPPGKLRAELGISNWPSLDQVANGDADAAYIKGAAARHSALKLGLRVVIDLEKFPIEARVNNGTPRPITVHEDLLQKRPEWVIDFLALTLKAAEWASVNPDETARIVGRETGTSAEQIKSLYGDRFHTTLAPTLEQDRLMLLALQIERLRRHGFIEHAFDVNEWAEAGLLSVAAQRARNRSAHPVPEQKRPLSST